MNAYKTTLFQGNSASVYSFVVYLNVPFGIVHVSLVAACLGYGGGGDKSL